MNANKSIIDHMMEKISDEQMESVSGGNAPEEVPEITQAAQPQNPYYWCKNCQTVTFHYGRKCSICGK